MGDGLLIDRERLGGKTEFLLEGGDLLGPNPGTVDGMVPGFGGQRPADDGVEFDDRGFVPDGLGRPDGRKQRVEVLLVPGSAVGPVNLLSVPTERVVTSQDVLGEGDVGVTLDGDSVGVIDHDEVAQILGGRQRRGLRGHTLLETAVADKAVDEVVEDRLALGCVRIEQAAFPARGHRHADCVADARAEGPGGALDEPGVAVLGMPRALGSPGSQRLQVLELEVGTGQVELTVLGQGGMTDRQDETIAAEPFVVGRIHLHDLLVEQVDHGGQ